MNRQGWQTDSHDQSEDSKRSDVSVKLGPRPLQRRQVSLERDHLHSVWSQLRNELLSTQRDLQIQGELRASDRELCADDNSEYQGKVLQHAEGQRYRTNQDENNERSLEQENMAPYNPSELRHKVLQALELAKGELAAPRLYKRTRSDECGLPFLNMLPTYDFQHEVVADKKTAATNAYQLRHEHHLPHAQFVQVGPCDSGFFFGEKSFVSRLTHLTMALLMLILFFQNWGQQLRNDRPLLTLIEPKAPRPPSAAKPSHLVGAGLGFNPQVCFPIHGRNVCDASNLPLHPPVHVRYFHADRNSGADLCGVSRVSLTAHTNIMQYRVKRREVDPRLEKSPYSTTSQTLPDGDKASSQRIARQKAVSAPGNSARRCLAL